MRVSLQCMVLPEAEHSKGMRNKHEPENTKKCAWDSLIVFFKNLFTPEALGSS